MMMTMSSSNMAVAAATRGAVQARGGSSRVASSVRAAGPAGLGKGVVSLRQQKSRGGAATMRRGVAVVRASGEGDATEEAVKAGGADLDANLAKMNLGKGAKKIAETFAPPITKKKNPAFKGSALYTVFGVGLQHDFAKERSPHTFLGLLGILWQKSSAGATTPRGAHERNANRNAYETGHLVGGSRFDTCVESHPGVRRVKSGDKCDGVLCRRPPGEKSRCV
jgi:hypothetical protein